MRPTGAMRPIGAKRPFGALCLCALLRAQPRASDSMDILSEGSFASMRGIFHFILGCIPLMECLRDIAQHLDGEVRWCEKVRPAPSTCQSSFLGN